MAKKGVGWANDQNLWVNDFVLNLGDPSKKPSRAGAGSSWFRLAMAHDDPWHGIGFRQILGVCAKERKHTQDPRIHGTNSKFSYMGWLNFMGISCTYILFVPWICIWEGSSFVNLDFLEIKGLKVPRVLDINKGRKTKSTRWCVFHAILRPWHPVISENDGVNNHRNETHSIDIGSITI